MKVWFVELGNEEKWLGQTWFLFNPKLETGQYNIDRLIEVPILKRIIEKEKLKTNDKVCIKVETRDCYFIVIVDGLVVSDIFEDINDAFNYKIKLFDNMNSLFTFMDFEDFYTNIAYVVPVELKRRKPVDFMDRLIDKYEKYIAKSSTIYLANRLFPGEYNIDAKELTLYDKKRILKRIAEKDIIEFYKLTLDCLLCQGKTILYKMLSDIHEQILISNDKETKKELFKKFRNITKKYLCLARELDTEINDMTFDIIDSITGDI